MYKKPIRMISLWFTIITLALSVSCAGTETAEVFDTDPFGGSGELDFDGAEVLFVTGWVEEWAPEVGYTAMGDNELARYNEIKEKYNCNIKFVYGDQNTVFQNVVAQFDIPDLLDCHTSQSISLYKADMLYALDDIGTIDLSDEKWGNKNFIRYGNFNGRQYGFFNYDWQFLPAILGTTIFDDTVLRTFNLQSPHEMLENGTWTWDEFEKMLEISTANDGEKQYVGLSFDNTTHLMQAAIFSNGGEIITENENGTKTSGVTSPKVIDALSWVAELNTNGYLGSYSHEIFNNHERLFFVGESFYFTHMTEYHQGLNTPVYGHDGYGFITFPTGPSGDYGMGGSFICEGRRLNWVIDAGPMDKEDLGKLMNVLFEPLTGTGKKAWNDFLMTNVFYYRETDAELFMKMVENTRYDWSAELDAAYDKLAAEYTAILNGKESAASAMQSVEEVLNEAITAFQ